MKKVLLYYPKICGVEDNRDLYVGIPLSVMTLAAQFDSKKYELKIIDGRITENIEDDIVEWIDNELLMVGISAITSYQIKDGIFFAEFIRNYSTNTKLVWGGWHPSLMPYETIVHPMVDIVIKGQGERAIVELADAISLNKEISHIPNLVIKESNGDVYESPTRFYADLNHYKSIVNSFSYVDVNRYIYKIWGNQRVIGYESSRGCPWHCRYCSISSVYNRKWNAMLPPKMIADIDYLYKEYSIDAIHFFDNNFFVDAVRVKHFCNLLIENKINVKWDGTCNVIQFLGFTDEYMKLLKRSGFYRVIIGIESGDEEVLNKIGKLHTNDQVLEVVKKCKRYNIQASFSFMVGFPWNPEQDFLNTINIINKIKVIDNSVEIMFFIFTPYCGTNMYQTALEYGMRFPQSLEEWSSYTYDKANTPWLTEKLRRKIKRYVSFFDTDEMSDKLGLFTNNRNE